MNSLKHIFTFLLIIVFFSTCTNKIDEPKPTSGTANFTLYAAIGGSFTSGYTDNALYLEGQQNSYPYIISKSFADAGGGVFKLPLVNEGVGLGVGGNAKYILTTNAYSCTPSLTFINPKPAAATGDASVFNYIGTNGPFNNLGVPGLKSYNINDQYFSNTDPQLGNPYYARFAKNPGSSTILSDISELSPTFFSLWVGEDDILQFATAGGENNNDSLAQSNYPASFGNNIDQAIMSVTSTATEGVIANIPDVTDFPFFTTIPYNGLVLTAAEALALNNLIAGTPDTIMKFYEGNNAFVIEDESVMPNHRRQIKSNEYVLMSVNLDSLKCAGYGGYAKPLANKYVLNTAELSLIRSRIINFNSKLKEVALSKDLAFVDVYNFFQTINQGIKFNGANFSVEFIYGGAFSLDGIHLTGKGNALLANEFIKAINKQYGSSLRLVDANAYPGIQFP